MLFERESSKLKTMNNPLLYLLVVPLLSASGGLAAMSVFAQREYPGWVLRGVIATGLLSAGVLLYRVLFQEDGLHFGFVSGLMCVAWVAASVAFMEGFFNRVRLLEMVVFPFCALVFTLPLLVKEEALVPIASEFMFRLHLIIAISAYSLMGLAAVHACIMVWQEKALHNPNLSVPEGRKLQEHILDQLPSLISMESTLFRQLWAGFGLLTLTLISGFVFAEQWTGKALVLDHKTLFSLVSWLSFAILLGGRLFGGWRGKRAVNWCLGSYAVLVLAYFGTQFVFEFILKRVA